MPDVRTEEEYTPKPIWKFGPFVWLKEPLPKGRRAFYEWRWEGMRNFRYIAIGRFAFRFF